MAPPGFPQYVPSDQVKQGHLIPHLNAAFALITDAQFAPTLEYVYSIVRFSGIVLALGWLLVLLFYLAMCIRCCGQCCSWLCRGCCGKRGKATGGGDGSEGSGRGQPMVLDDELVQRSSHEERPTFMDKLRHKVADHNSFRRKLVIFNCSCLLFLCIAAAVVFKGDTDINAAFDKVNKAVDVIISLFSLLITIADKVLVSVSDVLFQVSAGQCSGFFSASDAAVITNSASSVQQSMNTISSLSSPVVQAMHTFISAVEAQKAPKTQVYLMFFVVVLGLVVLFLLGLACKSPMIFRLAILLSAIILLVMTLLASVALSLVTALSDICVNPTATIMSLFPPSSDVHKDLAYYLFCQGANPFQGPIDTANSAIYAINATASAAIHGGGLPSSCSGPLLSDVSSISNNLLSMTGLVACSPMYELYDAAVQGAICTGGVNGVYDTMVVFWTTGFLLYVVMVSSNVFYNWYSRPEALEERDSMTDSIPPPASSRVRSLVDTGLGGSRYPSDGSERGGMGMHARGSPSPQHNQGGGGSHSPSTYPPLTAASSPYYSPTTTPARLLVTPLPAPSAPMHASAASTNPFGPDDPKASHLFAI